MTSRENASYIQFKHDGRKKNTTKLMVLYYVNLIMMKKIQKYDMIIVKSTHNTNDTTNTQHKEKQWEIFLRKEKCE